MAATFAAALVYFAILFLTRLAGNLLRVYLLAPMLGHALTAILELPVVLLIAWMASRALIRLFGMRRRLPHAAAMGALTFVLLILAEMLLSVLAGDRFVSVLRSYSGPPGALGLIGAFILAFFPAIQVALSRSLHR
ncbi:hypothetical protein [Amaricoccus solimangrovi]|uniref:Uncharacterized protein n=1 Tax=Amaricoccus solimangrovi TaxID=2589815 RepID=A0A501WU39_9RHOB|nr:hypothetical protein [Amaricoccus solimangrovi]TPE50481.1 hypothetical protein FJM51_11850 [Amaricoccus solimangrovi]